jgi:hypothetical protein
LCRTASTWRRVIPDHVEVERTLPNHGERRYALPEHVYVRLEDGTKVHATFDEAQRGEGRLSSVQYVKFAVQGQVPLAVGVDLPGLEVETTLTREQRAALAADLA